MNPSKLELRELRPGDESSFKRAIEEFATYEPEWTFAFHYDVADDFGEYLKRLKSWSEGRDLPGGYVANTYLVGVVEDEIVGRLSLRHTLNDFLRRFGGHIGYGVIPSQRKHGYATEMLRQALPVAKSLGINEVLITCDDDNIPSQKVIKSNGGVFENKVPNPDTDQLTYRYWIDLREYRG